MNLLCFDSISRHFHRTFYQKQIEIEEGGRGAVNMQFCMFAYMLHARHILYAYKWMHEVMVADDFVYFTFGNFENMMLC